MYIPRLSINYIPYTRILHISGVDHNIWYTYDGLPTSNAIGNLRVGFLWKKNDAPGKVVSCDGVGGIPTTM